VDCFKVQQSLPISAAATFLNQKMDGQVVDINGTLFLTQRSTTGVRARSAWAGPN
jgi:hypothetical protein